MKREEAIKILQPIGEQYCEIANITLAPRMDEIAEAIDMAIEALKAQFSQEGTTSDTISRQAAIDAVDAIGHIATMPDGDKCVRRSAVKYTLSMLPSAQLELIEKAAYIRGFEQGRTQGMIDAQGGKK